MMRQRDIFWFWLPLCASMFLMTAEGPIISATINRLPNAVIMLAAQGIVISLSVFIESPIIMLLSTSTALVKDRPSFELTRRFTIHWIILLTIITFLVGFTPFYDIVIYRWLETPPEVGLWIKPGMQIMLCWSAAIGWRRFLQGVLIHFNYGRRMAEGTALRLVTTAGTIISLAIYTDLPGIHISTIALMFGVLSEAAYATWAIQSLLQNELAHDKVDPDAPTMSYSELLRFHMPLAGTSVLILFVQPVVASAIARLDNPTLSLAAWPVVFQIMLLLRAPALSLPEAIIALAERPNSFAPLRRFTLTLTAIVLLLTFAFTYTPFADWYVYTVQGLDGEVAALTISAARWFLIYPALFLINAWVRGLLIHHKITQAVTAGMMINLTITISIVLIGVWMDAQSLWLAAIALNTATIAETIYLAKRAADATQQRIGIWGVAA